MNERRKNELFCDFEIKTVTRSFPVHRVVLHSSSEYFEGMLSNGMRESERGYCVVDDDTNAVDQCIEFMYTGKMDLISHTVGNILALSHRWLLIGAVDLCAEFMQKNLKPETCVDWINLATLYELDTLESKCMSYIGKELLNVGNLHKLGIETLKLLVQGLKNSSKKAKVMWNIVEIRITHQESKFVNEKSACALIQEFPVETFSQSEFQKEVLTNDHVTLCRPCFRHVTERKEAHAFKDIDIKLETCLAMKHLAVKHRATGIVQSLNRYIIKNFSQIFERDEFRSLVTEDQLMFYIQRIDRLCTVSEFQHIIEWIRESTDRESCFRKIFSRASLPTSKFKTSLFAMKLRTPRRVPNECAVNLSNCCFIRYLAEKYSSTTIAAEADMYICGNFHTIADNSDIGYLTEETMMGYVSQMCVGESDGGMLIWRTVQKWSENRLEMTHSDFARVFCSLRFGEFSVFCLQTISRYQLVIESAECMAKLNEILFGKVEDLERTTSDRLQQFFGHTKTKLAELGECYHNMKRDMRECSKKRNVTIKRMEDKFTESSLQTTERFQRCEENFEQRYEELRQELKCLGDLEDQIDDNAKLIEEANEKMSQVSHNERCFGLRLEEINQVFANSRDKADAKLKECKTMLTLCNEEVEISKERISTVEGCDTRAHTQMQVLRNDMYKVQRDMSKLRGDIEIAHMTFHANQSILWDGIETAHASIQKKDKIYKIALGLGIGLTCLLCIFK